MKTIVQTHGGLGNQLFQVFFGLLMSGNSTELAIIHNAKYKHKFKLEKEFRSFNTPIFYEKLISSIRLAKCLEKLTKGRIAYLYLGNKCYCDGYFQNQDLYNKFNIQEMRVAIQILKKKFQISDECNGRSLLHLRLRDFFKTSQAKLIYLETTFSSRPEAFDIITDDELVVRNYLSDNNIGGCTLVSTVGMTGSQILSLMSRYKKICSNNSTLAFWASVFSNAELEISDKKLAEFFKFLKLMS